MKKIEIFFFILNKFININSININLKPKNINMLSLDSLCKKTLI